MFPALTLRVLCQTRPPLTPVIINTPLIKQIETALMETQAHIQYEVYLSSCLNSLTTRHYEL